MLTALRGGFELMDHLTRPALPEIGKCDLRMRFGVINGKIIGLGADAFANIQSSGGFWSPTMDLMEVPSLLGKEIRIQLAADTVSDPDWATVWWGSCEYQSDNEWPAATMPVGERIYHCLDGLYRAKRWFMTQHAAYIDGDNYDAAPGHPGYNIGFSGQVLGNRSSSGGSWRPFGTESDTKFYYHTWQGSTDATVWTDLQAAEHALRVSRPEGQPQFSFAGTTDLLALGASPWKVEESDSAWDVVSRICARERGRGLVYVDWADDSASPNGPLSVRLSIKPQLWAVTPYYSNPTTGTTSNIPGAAAEGTTVAVDLIGDHRAQPVGFNRAMRGMSDYDAVETVGEPIEVLITASRKDGTNVSLENRWTSSDQTAFEALDPENRIDEIWRQVYQAYGIPRTWSGLAKDHDNGAEVPQHRVDYRCNDAGKIIVPTGSPDTSPLLVNVLPDTPLLEGYTYTGATPVRRAGQDETGEPARRPPAMFFRTSANKYIKVKELSLHIKHNEIHITKSDNDTTGLRFVSDTSASKNLGAAYDNNQVGVTIGIQLPHRLRFKTVRDSLPSGLGVRNIKRIEVSEAHLWLGSPGAIWDLDGTDEDAGEYTPFRGICGATTLYPGVLRDDRARVALLHALACQWYLQEHRPATWTLRACGLLPSFGIVTGGEALIDPNDTQTYPKLGQLVTTLAANGQTMTINAPITGIVYNHQAQTTTWSCDWVDLDVRNA